MTVIPFAFAVLVLASFLCLYRIGKGPTPPDRIVGIDTMGTLIVGFCVVLALTTGQDLYMNVAIAWALLSFICALALAKHLEDRPYHE
jgi:multicomponent Na+:H+ antiporter subunit F